MHYVGCFASSSVNNELRYMVKLLSMFPLEKETSTSADEYKEFLTYVLSFFGKSCDDVLVLIGGNFST